MASRITDRFIGRLKPVSLLCQLLALCSFNMLTPTLMKPMLILGLFFFLVISSCKTLQKKEEKPLTNAEKIARDVQKEFGAFDAVYHNDEDSLITVYTYRPEANKTQRVKGVIDKTLNMVGEEAIPNYMRNEHKYEWETPTEDISMKSVPSYKDSSSYINVWIFPK